MFLSSQQCSTACRLLLLLFICPTWNVVCAESGFHTVVAELCLLEVMDEINAGSICCLAVGICCQVIWVLKWKVILFEKFLLLFAGCLRSRDLPCWPSLQRGVWRC